MTAFFRYGFSTILLALALNSPALFADLVEFGYLIKTSEFQYLDKKDHLKIYNTMILDVAEIPKVHNKIPGTLREPHLHLEDLKKNYEIFRRFCLREISNTEISPKVLVCNRSFKLSHELLSKIIAHPYPSKYLSINKNSAISNLFDLVEKDHPNAPHIWDYVTYYKNIPKHGIGWKTIEGYVCTSEDPLSLREGPSTEFPIKEKMPPRSPLILHNYRPFDDWIFVQYGELGGYAHSSFLCIGNTREPVFTEEEENEDFSMDNFNFYISAKNSKCSFKDFPKTFKGPAGGNRKLWLNMCNTASGTTQRWCMDMTCPNIIPSAKNAFKKLYGTKVPFQLIPDSEQFGIGIELVRIVTKFEKAGLCINRINNWHRPKKYNSKVKGSSSSFHFKEGGAKAIDILFCDFNDQKKAAKLLNKWNKGWFLGGMGVYKNSPTLHVDLRGYAARW